MGTFYTITSVSEWSRSWFRSRSSVSGPRSNKTRKGDGLDLLPFERQRHNSSNPHIRPSSFPLLPLLYHHHHRYRRRCCSASLA